MAGNNAVEAAIAGEHQKMVTLIREGTTVKDYQCETGLATLSAVANGEKMLPREFIDENGTGVTQAFREYLMPLVQGEVPVEIGPDGLPNYVRLKRHTVEQKTSR
jgi:6-phosphofructokinase 1